MICCSCSNFGLPPQPVCVVLLQVVLYHQEACEAISDDALLELCDWCYRQLLFLNKDAAQIANKKGEHIAALPFQVTQCINGVFSTWPKPLGCF